MAALGPSCLEALRIVIVEDELIVCLLIEDILIEAGAVILGIAGDVDGALELIERTRPNAVTLDVRLRGSLSGAVAERLDELGIRYLVVTAESILSDPRLSAAPRLNKPFTPEALKAACLQHLC
jgi:CheY-like chemotaxis protein